MPIIVSCSAGLRVSTPIYALRLEWPTEAAAARTIARVDEKGGDRYMPGSTGTADGSLPESPAPGTRIADRYRLEQRLGSGTFAAVHRATDELTNRPVAVKLMRQPTGDGLGVWRREVATLRRANFPGVVQLLDEGRTLDHSFIVMNLVSGAPFPGEGAASSWADIEQATIGVLNALERLHWAGIVHRDLKPENVLVGEDGRPTIVDLGIAWDRGFDSHGMARSALAGSPRFMAPELFRGAQPTPLSDLYAVGLILFEVLAGVAPHDSPTMSALIRTRTEAAAPALRTIAPEVPARVAHAVDQLLAREPDERPQSAAAAIALLRGAEPPRHARHVLELLGVGRRSPPVPEARLRALFAGSERLMHIPEDAAEALLLRTAGVPGRVADELDAWIRAGIARSDGGRIAISQGAIENLQVDPVFHAARPSPEEARPRNTRAQQLAHIELCGAGATTKLIAAAWALPHEDTQTELTALERDGAVRQRGDAWVLVERAPRGPAWSSPSARAQVHRRIADSLKPGELSRLHHLVAAGSVDDVAREAAAIAHVLRARGRSGQAVAALLLGLTVARTTESIPSEAVDALLSQLLSAALTAHNREAIDVLLYQASRAPDRTPVVEGVELLARAAAHGQRGNATRSLRMLESDLPDGCASLEHSRHSIRLVTAQLVGEEALRDALRALYRYAQRTGSTSARRTLMTWFGWRRYRQLRFAAATRRHLQAARTAKTEFDRVSGEIDAAIAALDGFDFERAVALATACRDAAVAMRASHAEARAEWVLRSARYRMGEATTVAEELVAAAAELGAPHLEARLLQVEASVAWRAGDLADARRLASRAVGLAKSTGREPIAVLLESMLVACGAELEAKDAEDLLNRVDQCEIPGVAAQAAALLALSGHAVGGRLAEIVARNADRLPSSLHGVRREVLSIRECQDALRGA